MKTEIIKGEIYYDWNGDDCSCLYIGETPLADNFSYWFEGKEVIIRYWVSDKEMTKDELKENTLLQISGSVDADYGSAYSEYTGYLWTNANCKVGGHDLLKELDNHEGKYLYMEVDYEN